MTSPCVAVLTSSPTITLIPSAFAAASSAPEISLWSVIAIAPRPCSRACREQHLDRRRAVGRVVGVHVQVDVDQRPVAPGPRRGGGAARGAGARRPSRRPPRARRRRAPASACARSGVGGGAQPRRAARGRAARRRSWAASVSTSPGSKSRPRSPSREHLVVDVEARRERHDAGGDRREREARRGQRAAGGEDEDVGGREQRRRAVALVAAVGHDGADALAQARGQRDLPGARRPGRAASPPSRARGRGAAARAGRRAARRAPPRR